MTRFDRLIKMILRHEGGLVNDKDDAGGITNYGISLRFAASTGDLKLFDEDNDGDIDGDDIKLLDRETASEAYREYFYDPLKVDKFTDELLAAHLFDHGVNAGKTRAAKILQRLLGIKEDGVIGPITIAHANDATGLGKKYQDARLKFYFNISETNPKARKWINGWVNRVKDTQKAI